MKKEYATVQEELDDAYADFIDLHEKFGEYESFVHNLIDAIHEDYEAYPEEVKHSIEAVRFIEQKWEEECRETRIQFRKDVESAKSNTKL